MGWLGGLFTINFDRLELSMNPATGDGGTCYGDSGGPHFLGNSDMVVSLTVTGDAWCRATDVTHRLDIESARSYLAPFVNLDAVRRDAACCVSTAMICTAVSITGLPFP